MHPLLLNIHAHHMHTHQVKVGHLRVIQITITIWLKENNSLMEGSSFVPLISMVIRICTFGPAPALLIA